MDLTDLAKRLAKIEEDTSHTYDMLLMIQLLQIIRFSSFIGKRHE